jgi:hypothetical protein
MSRSQAATAEWTNRALNRDAAPGASGFEGCSGALVEGLRRRHRDLHHSDSCLSAPVYSVENVCNPWSSIRLLAEYQ